MVNGHPAPPLPAALTLYRSMKSDDRGRPRIGQASSMLGARLRDLNPDDQGRVGAGRGGVSVAPDPARLRAEFRPVRFPDGLSKLPLFAIDEGDRGADLMYHHDGEDRASDHGVIEAARQMLVSEYQTAVAATEPNWSPA